MVGSDEKYLTDEGQNRYLQIPRLAVKWAVRVYQLQRRGLMTKKYMSEDSSGLCAMKEEIHHMADLAFMR